MDHRREKKGRTHQAAVAVTVESFHSMPVAMGTPKVTVYPEVLLPASVLLFGPKVPEGLVVQAVGIAWYEIIAQLDQDPEFLARMSWRNFEEIIAGGYERAGYRVTLTPPSNDGGRDVIAERDDIGRIRIYDQVKRYAPGNPVPADDVRALLGVLNLESNVSKGVLSTTSPFSRLNRPPSARAHSDARADPSGAGPAAALALAERLAVPSPGCRDPKRRRGSRVA